MRPFAALSAGLLLAAACASAPAQAPAQVRDTRWTVATATCPVGCSDAMRSFLAALVGKPALISDTRFEAPFTDACDDHPTLRLAPVPVGEIARSLSAAAGPGPHLGAEHLGTSDPAPLSGHLFCGAGSSALPLMRILVSSPTRMLVLFEEQSLIELTPAP